MIGAVAMADMRQFIGGGTMKEICASDVGCLGQQAQHLRSIQLVCSHTLGEAR